jgi:hypothetical protein
VAAVTLTGCGLAACGGGPGSDGSEGLDLSGGGGSTPLSMSQVLKYAQAAGVPYGSKLAMAGAIAAAESSLKPGESSTNGPTSGCPSGSVDRGLWQVNSCYHSEVSASCAYDPSCNAKAMAKISSDGSNWSPWSTYKNGAYKKYLSEAQKAMAGLSSDAGSGGADAGGGGDAAGGEAGYAFVRPREGADRHRFIALAAGGKETLSFTWHEAQGPAPVADLWIDVVGRTVIQVSSIGDRPFARAGLDLVPLEPGAEYRIELSAGDETVMVSLVQGADEVLLRAEAPSGGGANADVVRPSTFWRSALEGSSL